MGHQVPLIIWGDDPIVAYFSDVLGFETTN